MTASLLAVVTLLLAAGLPYVRTDFSYRPALGENHPSIRALEGLVEQFGGGYPLRVVWGCGPDRPCNSVFDRSSLEMAHAVTTALESQPNVRLVQSPATAPILVPSPWGFETRRLVEFDEPVSDTRALGERALVDRLWVGRLISADGTTGAILVQPSDSKSTTSVGVVEAVQAAVAPFEALGFEFHLEGHAVGIAIGGRELAESTQALVPLTALIIALVLLVLSRSWQTMAISMGTMGVAVLWTFGLLGWLGWPRVTIFQMLAPLILIVGVCDAIHLFSRYATYGSEGTRSRGSRAEALRRAAREVGRPCLLTSLTTAAAFLSFATSDLQTFVRFGVIASFGVLACLLLTFTLIPILVVLLPGTGAGAGRVSESWNALLESIVRTSERRALPILGATMGLFILFGIGWVGYLRVDTDRYEMFGEQSRMMRWLRFVEQRLGPTENLEIQVTLPPSARIESPEVLETMTDFSTFLSGLDRLGETLSVRDLIARLNRLLHDDDPAFDRPAETLEGNAELLELLTMQDPALLDGWLSFDRSTFRISVSAQEQPASSRGEVLEAVGHYVESEIPADWALSFTGPFAIGFDWIRDVQATQIRSFVTAFVLIFALIALFLRSIRLAVAGMIPTLLPVVVILGAMGLVGITLDVGRTMIAAIVLGIAVDDSVHLLSRYRRRRAQGESPADSMRGAVLHVGRAVITTSLALSVGFLTLLASPWQTVSSFGFFVSLAILGALAADLFVLPALVFALAGERRRVPTEGAQAERPSTPRPRVVRVALVSLPVVAAIVTVALVAAQPGPQRELACWILPNGRVAPLPGSGSGCPLEANDQIRSVQRAGGRPVPMGGYATLEEALRHGGSSLRLEVGRHGDSHWTRVPIHEVPPSTRWARLGSASLIAGVLLVIPLLVLWNSSVGAALPFALFYSATGLIFIAGICGQGARWPGRMALVAMATVPATLTHLSLTFPRERKIVRDAPRLLLIPYLLTGFFLPAAWLALERDPVVWPTVIYLLLALSAAAWVVLLLSCAYAIRESASLTERARARVLLYGALLLPLLPTAVLAADSPSGTVLTYLGVSALVMPLPIGLAISRYNLFNLAVDARAWVGRMAYLASAAAILTAIYGAIGAVADRASVRPDLTTVFSLCFVSVAGLELARARVLRFFGTIFGRQAQLLQEIRETYERAVGELQDEEDVARLLGETVRAALLPRGGCVLLRSGQAWHPVHPFGEDPPAFAGLGRDASSLGETAFVHQLSIEGELGSALERRLRAAGVEIIARAGLRGEDLAILLVSAARSGVPYNRLELDFVETTVRQASLAFYNARLAEDLVAAEGHATTGRIAVALAHDLGKELEWLRQLVERLPQRLTDPKRLARDLGNVRQLTDGVTLTIRRFIRDATRPADPSGALELDQMVDRAVRAMYRIHGDGRIARSIDPQVREIRLHRSVERVLTNLLDNALLASASSDPVHLYATRDETWIEISVNDHGCGIPGESLERAFEPGFTTRRERGGTGIGLTVSREIVESLGGSLELRANPNQGIRATARIPADRSVR